MSKIRWRILDTHAQNSHSFVDSSYSLPAVSAGRTARELWWTSQEFSPAGINTIITMAFHAHISPGDNNRSIGGRGSETSHPIDMLNQSLTPFPNSSYAFRTLGWFHRVRDHAPRLRRTPPIASFGWLVCRLVGWLVGFVHFILWVFKKKRKRSRPGVRGSKGPLGWWSDIQTVYVRCVITVLIYLITATANAT
jgi:hypothetical protein